MQLKLISENSAHVSITDNEGDAFCLFIKIRHIIISAPKMTFNSAYPLLGRGSLGG